MTNTKTTKRALFASTLSLLLCIAMLVGSTFAWFTDTASTGINKITAGNLDVELEYFDGTAWTAVDPEASLFQSADETLWEPGHTEYVNLRIRNAGSLALQYDFRIGTYGAADGVTPEKTFINQDGDPFKLSDYLIVNQLEGTVEPTDREDLWLDSSLEEAALGRLDGTGAAGVLLSGEVKELTLAVYMPTFVGNEANQSTEDAAIEKANVYLGLDLMATQTPYEYDSFNNKYDALVTVPEFIYTAEMAIYQDDVVTAQNDGGTIKVMGVAAEDDETGADSWIKVIPQEEEDEGTSAYITSTISTAQSAGDADYAITVSAWEVEVSNMSQATISTYVGRGLNDVVMHHNGEAMTQGDGYTVGTYYYDSDTGYVTYTNDSFSPYDITYETPTALVLEASLYTSSRITKPIVTGEYTYASIAEIIYKGGSYRLTKDCVANNSNTVNVYGAAGNTYACWGVSPGNKNVTLDLDLDGFTVELNTTSASVANYYSVPMTISNGRIEAYNMADFISGNITLNNIEWVCDNTSAPEALLINHGGTLTIGEGTKVTSSSKSVTIFMGDSRTTVDYTSNPIATLNVYGAVENTGSGKAICGNGSDSWGTVVNIYDPAVVTAANSTAIYNPQKGDIHVYGGLIEGTTGAIGFKCDTLNIYGGTLRATKSFTTDISTNGSGISGNGSAITVDAHTNYSSSPTINIYGGSIISEHNFAIREIGNESSEPTRKLTLNIEGGTLQSGLTNGTDETDNADGMNDSQQLPGILLRAGVAYDMTISENATVSVGEVENVAVSYCQYEKTSGAGDWRYHQNPEKDGWQDTAN